MTTPKGNRLVGVDAKLGRAREHLDALKAELRSIYDDPKTVRLDQRSDWEFRLIADFPDLFHAATVAGDAVQNLRSALDHLIWALVARNASPGRHTQFPIIQKRRDFLIRAFRGTKQSKPYLMGLAPRSYAVRLIVAAQPYRSSDPGHHMLALLAHLSNLDKHQTLYTPIHLLDPKEVREAIGWNPLAILTGLGAIASNSPIEGQTELVWITFDPAGPPGNVHMKRRFSVTPTFGVTMNVSYRVLADIHAYVAAYVGEFRKLFT
ncbi:MAG TPA: hypothetical protein VMS74_04880 [Acidimicrobiia bacterium]|nr:hypothetical protein [Acidimicrobiia bacterium]